MTLVNHELSKRAALSVFAGACALLAFSVVRADVVVLKNSDRISGDILERGAEQVTVSTSYAGPISIPRSEISRIESGAAPKPVVAEKAAPMNQDVVIDGKEHVWPNFNLADAAICVAVSLLIIREVRTSVRTRDRGKAETVDAR